MDIAPTNDKKNNVFLDFFKNIGLVIVAIFEYAFVGLKACTYDLFVFIYNKLSWHLDKAYKRTIFK